MSEADQVMQLANIVRDRLIDGGTLEEVLNSPDLELDNYQIAAILRNMTVQDIMMTRIDESRGTIQNGIDTQLNMPSLVQSIAHGKASADKARKLLDGAIDKNFNLFQYDEEAEKYLAPSKRKIRVNKEAKEPHGPEIVYIGGQGAIIGGYAEELRPEDYERLYIAAAARAGYNRGEGEYFGCVKGARADLENIKGGKKKRLEEIRSRTMRQWAELFADKEYVFNPDEFFGNVVVKILDAQDLDREKTVQNIAHVNIMPVLSMGKLNNGACYVIMPRIPEEKRIDYNPEEKKIDYSRMQEKYTLDEIIDDVMIPLCGAFATVHEDGLVHRDIKPGNIMILEDKGVNGKKRLRPIVTDFGIVKTPRTMDLSLSGQFKGTSDYIAPEQALDAKYATRRADIYSLGMVFYEMLTGGKFVPEGTTLQDSYYHTSRLCDGEVVIKPKLPALVKEAIDRYKLGDNQDKYGFWEKRKKRKKVALKMKRLGQVLGAMMRTQNTQPFIKSVGKKPEYRDKPVKCYLDLKNGGPGGDKHQHAQIAAELRYPTMTDVVKDLHRIREGNKPLCKDYTKKLFSR